RAGLARRGDVPDGRSRDARRAGGAGDLPRRVIHDVGAAGPDRAVRGVLEGGRRRHCATRGDRDGRDGRSGTGGGAGGGEPRPDATWGVGAGGGVGEGGGGVGRGGLWG